MTVVRLPVVIIAAVGQNGVIGTANRLPWRLPGDLAHFRAETWGKPVIFGRKTLEAIGKALPGRSCIALSQNSAFHMAGAITAPTLEAALDLADREAHRTGATEILVAGGASVYAAALPLADEMRLTSVDLQPDGDAVFPTIDPSVWQEIERVPAALRDEDEVPYAFVRYIRRRI